MHQDACAMKVCTDACLFGAWVAKNIQANHKNVLDIGTGTGLLSLVLAQADENIMVDAVELDRSAAGQAAQNFFASPFVGRLKIYQQDILQFQPEKLYDLIISNPPFYENDLKSEHAGKNAAKHDTQLTLAALIDKIEALLYQSGTAAILLPYHRMNECGLLLHKRGFAIHKKLMVHQSSRHEWPFRVCWIFGKEAKSSHTETIFIKGADQHYTPQFIQLLKPYYLKL